MSDRGFAEGRDRSPGMDRPSATDPYGNQANTERVGSIFGTDAGAEIDEAGMGQSGGQESHGIARTAGEAVDTVKEQLAGATGRATELAGKGVDTAASGLNKAADKLRDMNAADNAPGMAGTAAAKAADTLDSASRYLQRADAGTWADDLQSIVREHPTQSLLVAAGAGFLLSRLSK
jgi:ElaB/YqjD/DUF883 family membrane-anchored ribosome-binding protein